jgi:N-methylhydantoinase B
LRRPVEKVLEEVRNDILSVEKAKDEYGVIIDPVTLEVGLEATHAIRGW